MWQRTSRHSVEMSRQLHALAALPALLASRSIYISDTDAYVSSELKEIICARKDRSR